MNQNRQNKICRQMKRYFFHIQGLVQINSDVVSLAAKAREGKLQPQEFQVCWILLLNQ